MRLRARPYVHWAPVPGGAYVSGPQTELVLRGPEALHVVLDTCVPLLEEGTSEDELVAALGTEQARPAVRLVVQAFEQRGLLLPLATMTGVEPPEDVRAEFGATLAQVESWSDDPYRAFSRLRTAAVLLLAPEDVAVSAARGLLRSGVREVRVGRPVSPSRRTTLERLGVVVQAVDVPSAQTSAAEGLDADLVVWCCDDGSAVEAQLVPLLSAGVPVLPVQLGDDVVVVGPLLHGSHEGPGWPAWVARVRAWAAVGTRARPAMPVARPGGDVMAGALGAALTVAALTGEPVGRRASVLTGGEVEVEQVQLAAVEDYAGAARLRGLQSAPLPDLDDLVTAAARLTAPWSGSARVTTPLDLSQIPLACSVLSDVDGSRPVAGWGADQPTALLSAVLAHARRSSAGAGAAGVTEERWLLDGVLRALVPAGPYEPVEVRDQGPRCMQLLRALQDEGGPRLLAQVAAVQGLDWVVGRVADAASGQVLANAWGPDAAAATTAACAVVLCRTRLDAHGVEAAVALVSTDALITVDDAGLALLRRQVDGLAGAGALRCDGRGVAPDPVLGQLPFRRGRVDVLVHAVELAGA